MDPKDRITGIEAINHPYFDPVREPNYAQAGNALSSVGSGSNVNRSIQSSHGFRLDSSAVSSAGVGGKTSKAANKVLGSSNNLASQTQAGKKLQSNPLSRIVLPQQTSSVLS